VEVQVSTPEIVGLGAIAGFTIFLGLPMGRLRNPAPRLQAFLNAIAIGILVFLLFDVLAKANDSVETALKAATNSGGSWWRFVALAAIFAGGAGVGLLSLVHYDRFTSRRRRRGAAFGPGAMAVGELEGRQVGARAEGLGLSSAQQLGLLIALGIGLHNFAEGLAIGQSGAKGEIGLALMLVIGFGLHNATEGFGIVAPLAAASERASWGYLGLVGLIGGGPTFLGTLLGQSFVNNELFVAFLALAAGSILYVVIQLVQVAQKLGYRELLMWGVFVGLVLGFATDYVLVAAGA
jgi:ZIP family zinc transporter